VAANIADPCDAKALKALDATKYIAVKAVADKKTGAYPCTLISGDAATKIYAKWTGAGWADAKADDTTTAENTTGAKAMAGALAAGALAVAATQFWGGSALTRVRVDADDWLTRVHIKW